MSALESPHLLLPLEKPTDRRAATPPSHNPSRQRAQETGGRQGHISQPRTSWARRGRDRFPPQREPTLPQVDVDFKPAERRAHFHCLKPPRVWYWLWPLYTPFPPSPKSSPQLAHHQALFHDSFLIRPFYRPHHRLEHSRLSHPELAPPVDQPLRIHRPLGLEGTLSSRPIRTCEAKTKEEGRTRSVTNLGMDFARLHQKKAVREGTAEESWGLGNQQQGPRGQVVSV
ncbi:uncharacterized protein [Gorilla gorilla gorilla]|uniref:uncharacterized protein isoform X2 n=1 Tax=Gorilla gorilla gorilla TaxID=9595 RepID=UPI0024456C15|nr:uncharacterized protein LOC109026333 isoform X2 [Gorilla gorilla gorilla]